MFKSMLKGCVFVGALTLASGAMAQQSWTGLYAGAQIGAAWQQQDTTFTPIERTLFIPAVQVGAVSPGYSGSASGFIGGGLIGYNYQMGSVVLGGEADISWLSGKSEASDTRSRRDLFFPNVASRTENTLDWLATIRARAGYLVNRQLLVYVSGGVAGGHVDSKTTITPFSAASSCANNFLCSAGSGSGTKWGWTVGGGADYALSSNWVAKLDYLYYDLGSVSYNAVEASPLFVPQPIPNGAVRTDVTGHLLRVGIAYKF